MKPLAIFTYKRLPQPRLGYLRTFAIFRGGVELGTVSALNGRWYYLDRPGERTKYAAATALAQWYDEQNGWGGRL